MWLQHESILAHQKITYFENLQEWKIDANTVGIVYKNGKPFIEPVFDGKGIYNLYITENTETERENNYFVECYFEITEKRMTCELGDKQQLV